MPLQRYSDELRGLDYLDAEIITDEVPTPPAPEVIREEIETVIYVREIERRETGLRDFCFAILAASMSYVVAVLMISWGYALLQATQPAPPAAQPQQQLGGGYVQ